MTDLRIVTMAAATFLGAAAFAYAGEQGQRGNRCDGGAPGMAEYLDVLRAYSEKQLTIAYDRAG